MNKAVAQPRPQEEESDFSSTEETALEAKDVLEQLESEAREIGEITQIVRSGNATDAEFATLERKMKEASTRIAASQGEAEEKMQHLEQKLEFKDKLQEQLQGENEAMQENLKTVERKCAIQVAAVKEEL